MKKKNKKKAGRLFALISTLVSLTALLLTALSSCIVFKLYRYITTAQKALPTIEKAAKIYIAEHSEPPTKEE